jgi:hypothetical protein
MHNRSKQGELNRLASLPKGKKHWRWSKNPTVSAIHRWLNKWYGRANRCEGKNHDSTKLVKKFDYALIKGKKYARNRAHFIMLCRRCHLKYDWNLERQNKVVKNLNRKGYIR